MSFVSTRQGKQIDFTRNGVNWRNQASWLTTTTPLPAEIGNLLKLQEFNLSVNQLSTLPGEVGTLTKLLALRLDYNRLTTLPAEISHLHKLQVLTLHNITLPANALWAAILRLPVAWR